ncbi:uncharacterized protein LOC113551897 [Rhopalosiphum maidis]|uniref:uncharacterized protein LOC113551897 n=1 Tax=Rhopalosiphum maidis TaxID=43146 RepID=UPI000F006842|nr:uncharacterized protein LOC113551897 [Rhopalosiphum maidis]
MSKDKFDINYSCVCDHSYSQKRQVRRHVNLCEYAQNPTKKNLQISKCEIYSVKDNLNANKVQSTERFKCGCEKRFLSKGGYYRHIKTCKLRPAQQVVTGKTKCNEPGCLLTFKYIRDFRQHLNEKHQIKFDVEDKRFDNYADFLNWKVKYESETRSCFYHRKNLSRSGRRVEYWYCNRSGSYQSALQSRRRKLKSQGILKINNNCTSSITLTINKIDDTVQAVIYHTHYGHEADLAHLRISKSVKLEIASKLLQGVKIEDILQSYKEDGSSKQTERKHLIKRRDILNISKKYNNIILSNVQPSKKKNELDQETIKPLLLDSKSNTIEINKRHFIASQLSLSLVSQIHEKAWRISMENSLVLTPSNNHNQDIYDVTKNDVLLCSSDDCKTYCNYCNICYHAYSCKCSDYISKKIICEHVHLTVLFQAKSQAIQYKKQIERSFYGNEDHTKYTQRYIESSNPQPIKNVQLGNHSEINNILYKQNMKAENLKRVKLRLKKMMTDTLVKIDACNNSDLLEKLEKQITNITHNLDTDILENTTKKRSEVQTMLPEKNIEVYYVF